MAIARGSWPSSASDGLPTRPWSVGTDDKHPVVRYEPGNRCKVPEAVREHALQAAHQQWSRVHQEGRFETTGIVQEVRHGPAAATPGDVLEGHLVHQSKLDEHPTDLACGTVETTPRSRRNNHVHAFRHGQRCRRGER